MSSVYPDDIVTNDSGDFGWVCCLKEDEVSSKVTGVHGKTLNPRLGVIVVGVNISVFISVVLWLRPTDNDISEDISDITVHDRALLQVLA